MMKKARKQEKVLTRSLAPAKLNANAPSKNTNGNSQEIAISTISNDGRTPHIITSQYVPTIIKFPSIGRPPVVFPHIQNAAQYVGIKNQKPFYNKSLPLPTLVFKGTVKVDGANCAIVKTKLGTGAPAAEATYVQFYQSRQKVLAVDNDFNGFVAYMVEYEEVINKLFEDIVASMIEVKHMHQEEVDSIETIAIFGEWCGDNIQRNVAISQLQKVFIIFAVKVQYEKSPFRPKPEDQLEWMDMMHLEHIHNDVAKIYNIEQFDAFEVTIDFSDEKSKKEGLEIMTDYTRNVQEECPVSKALGVTGKLMNGEGIVWKPVAVKSPMKLEKFTGPKCWVKTGAKSIPTNNEERMRLTKKGW